VHPLHRVIDNMLGQDDEIAPAAAVDFSLGNSQDRQQADEQDEQADVEVFVLEFEAPRADNALEAVHSAIKNPKTLLMTPDPFRRVLLPFLTIGELCCLIGVCKTTADRIGIKYNVHTKRLNCQAYAKKLLEEVWH
jgi:hypothetical protein